MVVRDQDALMSGERRSPEVLAEPKGFEENRWHGDCEGNRRIPSTQLGQAHRHDMVVGDQDTHTPQENVETRSAGGAQGF
jgi:hypothetical protein